MVLFLKGSEFLCRFNLRALFFAVDCCNSSLVLVDGAGAGPSLFCFLQDTAVLHLLGKAIQERAYRFTFSTF